MKIKMADDMPLIISRLLGVPLKEIRFTK